MAEPGGGSSSAMAKKPDLRAIQDVANELGVSTRTLRFYEDKGLIAPQRVGTMRVYTKREVARMQLILRGKHLGFSLKEIKAFLDLYDADPQHAEQMRHLSERVHHRIGELQAQYHAIEQTIADLRIMEQEAEDRLRAILAAAERE